MQPYKIKFDNKEFYIIEERNKLWIQTPEKEKKDLGLITALKPDSYGGTFETKNSSCTTLIDLINQTEKDCYLKISVIDTEEYWYYGSLDDDWKERQQITSKNLLILKKPKGYMYIIS